jgi:adenylate cyclase, class 2
MALEIEIKAWVDDPGEVEENLRSLYGDPIPVHKEDIYYTADDKFPQLNTLRLRRSGGKWIFTYKDKSIENGTEINREHETLVESFEVMDEFLKRVGCRYYLEKKKRGLLFSSGGLTIELVEIEGLGTFLEVEKVVPEGEVAVESVRAELLAVFDRAGVPRKKIEARYYSDMLMNRE